MQAKFYDLTVETPTLPSEAPLESDRLMLWGKYGGRGRRHVARMLVRRRWFILLPVAVGLMASVNAVTSARIGLSRESGVSATSSAVVDRVAARARGAVAGGAGGLVLGLALVAWLEYRSTGVTSEDDVTQKLMLPVLGTIGILKPEHQLRSQRLRRIAVDVAGSMVVALAVVVVLSALWSVQ